ncbi:protein chibby homolog 1 [Drosophila pseudoobscura]|uniref:Protein chibby homolog 1 n=1 Tax=Drosophila pseudoobscura pseudoobscura TaxID=46245 RepID=A0A6I8UN15_DROPS|nr:protein chibby homolog 1 [Drosophila pseudoobscura]
MRVCQLVFDSSTHKQFHSAMPLFNKKFESKPIPLRQNRCNIGIPAVAEDLDDFRQISLNLGNKELRFADGIWMHSSRKGDVDDMLRLKKKFRVLEEENNMSNLKMEFMLDLLAEQASELNELKPREKSTFENVKK